MNLLTKIINKSILKFYNNIWSKSLMKKPNKQQKIKVKKT